MFHPASEKQRHGLTTRNSLEGKIIGYVDSQTNEAGKWPVRALAGGLVYCTCPAYLLSEGTGKTCKHMPDIITALMAEGARKLLTDQ